MTILIAGDFRYSMYESALADALARRGMNVVRHRFFPKHPGFMLRGEAKYNWYGPGLYSLNRRFIQAVTHARPDVVFVWRGIHVRAESLRHIRNRSRPLLLSYNIDDAFAPAYASSSRLHLRRVWKYYRECVPHYDLHFVVRDQNIADLFSCGATDVLSLRRYYVPSIHRPLRLDQNERSRFDTDVVFVGHYEDDGRADCIRALLDAGIKVRLFGSSNWNQPFLRDITVRVGGVREVFDDEYARAICGARFALCFYSQLNRDQDTFRTYEIPACRTVLLSELSPLIERFYRRDEEVVLFSSAAECVQKVKSLLLQPERLAAIAEAGYRRLLSNHCSVDDRAKEIESAIEQNLNAALPHLAGAAALAASVCSVAAGSK